jgi:hypothetical protein
MMGVTLNHIYYLIVAEGIAKARYEDASRAIGVIDTSTTLGRENFEALGRIQLDWQEARERTMKALLQLGTH